MATPTWSWLLTRWTFEPSIIVALLAMSAAYAASYRVRERVPVPRVWPWRDARIWMFGASMVTLVVALLSPLDFVGDRYLFSAHMIQHLLLATVWPPLILMGLPENATASIFRVPAMGAVLKGLTHPVVAFVIFNVDISIWHLPSCYDLTLTNEWVHILEHLTFMAAGVLLWWPVLSPIRSQRLSYPGQLLYLFANLFPTMGLGVFFSFYQHPLYAPYVHAPRIWGISSLTDQQLGGLVMWMPGNLPYALAMAFILVGWLDRGEPRVLSPPQAAAAPSGAVTREGSG